MTNRDHTEKSALRSRIRAQCLQLSCAEVLAKSQRIQELLFSLPVYDRGSLLLFYMAVRGEVQTTQMVRDTLERGKRVAVPFIETTTRTLRISIVEDVDRDLGPGHFGILEPYVEAIREVSPTLIELVILPGVAFDTAGGRLGRGGGYYDRLLATLSPAVPKIGLAFALQIIPCVPTLPYDIPIDILVTEEGVVCCQKVRARENTDSLSKG